MRSADEFEPGRRSDGPAIDARGAKTPALADGRKKLALPPGVGRFHNVDIEGNARGSDVKPNRYGCVLFLVNRRREFCLDENRPRRQRWWLEYHADHMPVPQGPRRAEENLLIDPHVHGNSVSYSRFELPSAHAFHRAFIQAQAERAGNLNVARLAIGAYHQRQQYATLKLCEASFFRVPGRRLRNHKRRGDIRSRTEHRRLSGGRDAGQQKD